MEPGPLDRLWSRGRTSRARAASAGCGPSAGRSRSARSRPASPGWSPPTCCGHQTPFFAPIAAVVSLGTSYGQRLRRVAEVTVGVAVGVFVGDLHGAAVGSGWWQLTLIVGAGDDDGDPARRRPAVRHPGGGAVDRGEHPAARPGRRR